MGSLQRIGIIVLVAVLLSGCQPAANNDDERGGTTTGTVPGSSRLAGLLGGEGEQGFPRAFEPIDFQFPLDHGAHPSYRNEWWYVTGNLDTPEGRRFGFELTLFRFSLAVNPPVADSAWRSRQIYIGHFAITDVAEERFYVSQRYSRGAAGLAGAESAPLRVWLEDWQIEALGSAGEHQMPWRLRARSDEAELVIDLEALKPLVLNGEGGLSQKSAEPGNASYYYSMPRLAASGELTLDGQSYEVDGLAWLDREWSSSALSATQVGWDWFSLQLDDETELMFYQLRNADGSIDRYSSGTFVQRDGVPIKLSVDDVKLSVLDYWSNLRGDRYPIAWSLAIPSLALSVDVRPVIEDQELSTTVRYWEGAVDVSGRRGSEDIDGRGYVELTGYSN